MRAPDPGAAILDLMGGARNANGQAGRGNVAQAPALPVAPGAVVVKVCGVVHPEDARCAVAAGSNLIGVIFAKSKRQASAAQAKEVVGVVRKFGERVAPIDAPPRQQAPNEVQGFAQRCIALRTACKRTPLIVGVFMDQPIDEVVKRSMEVGVDAVQLHGAEDPDFVTELRRRLPRSWVLKVVHLPPRGDGPSSDVAFQELKSRLEKYASNCDALLLDTAVKGSVSGGTGAAFDWEVARRVQDDFGVPVIVAGGLTDTNVADLVNLVQPFGVDVASGVEDAPGRKNLEKTAAYVKGAKRARVGAF